MEGNNQLRGTPEWTEDATVVEAPLAPTDKLASGTRLVARARAPVVATCPNMHRCLRA